MQDVINETEYPEDPLDTPAVHDDLELPEKKPESCPAPASLSKTSWLVFLNCLGDRCEDASPEFIQIILGRAFPMEVPGCAGLLKHANVFDPHEKLQNTKGCFFDLSTRIDHAPNGMLAGHLCGRSCENISCAKASHFSNQRSEDLLQLEDMQVKHGSSLSNSSIVNSFLNIARPHSSTRRLLAKRVKKDTAHSAAISGSDVGGGGGWRTGPALDPAQLAEASRRWRPVMRRADEPGVA